MLALSQQIPQSLLSEFSVSASAYPYRCPRPPRSPQTHTRKKKNVPCLGYIFETCSNTESYILRILASLLPLYTTCKRSKLPEFRWYWLQMKVTTSCSLASGGNACLCTCPVGPLICVSRRGHSDDDDDNHNPLMVFDIYE